MRIYQSRIRHWSTFFLICPFNLASHIIQIRSSWKFAAYCKVRFRLCATNSQRCSFKFVPWHGQWCSCSTILNKTLTKMNAKDVIAVAVKCMSSDCDWRIWIVIHVGFPGKIRKFDNQIHFNFIQIRQIMSCRENYHSYSFSYHSI